MCNAKYIRISPDTFDDEKLKMIEGMPDGNSIIVIWFKLLCLAGKKYSDGVFMLNGNVAYTDEMLATIFRRPPDMVRLALNTFERLDMISVSDGVYSIPNWRRDSIWEDAQRFRCTPEYRAWRKSVFERDDYTCKRCGKRGVKLNAHHIMQFAYYPKLRLETSNGVALCEDCHKLVHKREGRKCRTE